MSTLSCIVRCMPILHICARNKSGHAHSLEFEVDSMIKEHHWCKLYEKHTYINHFSNLSYWWSLLVVTWDRMYSCTCEHLRGLCFYTQKLILYFDMDMGCRPQFSTSQTWQVLQESHIHLVSCVELYGKGMWLRFSAILERE